MENFFVREFSKDFSKKERNETAQEIKSKRKTYFSHADDLDRQIQELHSSIEGRKEDIISAQGKLAELDEKLSEAQESSIGKLLDYLDLNNELKSLRSEKEATTDYLKGSEIEYQKFQTLLLELQQERESKMELHEARETLSKFYAKQSEEASAFQEEQMRLRNLQNVAKNYDAVFIHGIHPNYVPGINSMVREDPL